MDDTATAHALRTGPRPTLDFQEHLAALDRAGLARARRSSDQQGQGAAPAGALAVRWRARRGGSARVPLHQRRRQPGPALRHSRGGRRARGLAADLCHRHGPAGRGDRSRLARRDRPSDSAGAGERGAVPGGGHHRRRVAPAQWRAQAAAGAGIDAGLRFRALSHRDHVHHARSRDRRAQCRDLSRRAQGDRPAGGAHGGAAFRRRRRLPALAQIPCAQGADADRHRLGLRPRRRLHRPAEARGRSRRDGGRRRARGPADPAGEGQDHRSRRACDGRNRDRGHHRHEPARARSALRREQRLCRARGLQHADAGDGHHHEARAGVQLDHQPGDAERILRHQESRLRAAIPRASARIIWAYAASGASSCTSP